MKALKLILVAAAIVYLGAYFFIVASRIHYPFELEWVEGATLEHVNRILSGKVLYPEPTVEFIPFNYPPLYYYVSAAFVKILGAGLVPLRLVSFCASLVTFLFVYLLVRKETSCRFAGLVAVGLFAALYWKTGQWFDLARVDSLFTMLIMISLYFLRKTDSVLSCSLAGVGFGLAFFTKQNALVILAPFIVSVALIRRRAAIALTAAFGVVTGVTVLAMNRLNPHWYNFYVFKVPFTHNLYKSALYEFWWDDLVVPLNVAVMATVALLILLRLSEERTGFYFYFPLVIGLILTSYSNRIHEGCFLNVLIPAYLALSICFGIGVKALLDQSGSDRLRIMLLALAALQFAVLFYDPTLAIPKKTDRRAGDRFVESLKNIPGEVYVTGHCFIPAYAGKGSYAHSSAVYDILHCKDEPLVVKFKAGLRETFNAGRFAAVIVDDSLFDRFLKSDYFFSGKVWDDDSSFFPVTGYRTRPELLYKRK